MTGVIGADKPLSIADVTVGTKIIVRAVRRNVDIGRFTISTLPKRDEDGEWQLTAVMTGVPGFRPIEYEACYLGLVQNHCPQRRNDPRIAYFDPNP